MGSCGCNKSGGGRSGGSHGRRAGVTGNLLLVENATSGIDGRV